MSTFTYVHEHRGIAHAVFDLPTGNVEVWYQNPETFATNREITQTEYDAIQRALQKLRTHSEIGPWQ